MLEAYRVAIDRLREVGATAVADRFELRAARLGKPALRRPALPAAIQHAIDAGGCRIAARLDPNRGAIWLTIAEDQHGLAAERLRRVQGVVR